MTGYLRILACIAITGLGAACSSDSSGPFAGGNPAAPAARAASNSSHAVELHPVVGEGTGFVNVTPNARGGFVANTEDVVSVHGLSPNTLLYVRVAADVGLPGQQDDGICQRASLGQFQPLALYPGGPPATFETSAGGSGTVHVTFGVTNPAVSDRSRLDLMFRVVDALPPAVPTIDLRTGCFTIEIK